MKIQKFFPLKFLNKVWGNETSAAIKEFSVKETVFVGVAPNENVIAWKGKRNSIDLCSFPELEGLFLKNDL